MSSRDAGPYRHGVVNMAVSRRVSRVDLFAAGEKRWAQQQTISRR